MTAAFPFHRLINRLSFLVLFLLFFVFPATAQQLELAGTVRDAGNGDPIPGVNVVLRQFRDTLFFRGEVTDEKGQFVVSGLKPGMYRMELSYVGYRKKTLPIRLNDNLRLDTLTLNEDTELLNEAVVTEQVAPVTQNGDTTEYRADAYKVNPDATGADLVKKMPGVTTKDGKLQAQGEEVKKVTIDGQDFFGEDAISALKNLPAEIIDKVQVYDRLSDQSQFTGFNDGNTTKTINIVTKSGKANGQFGRVYAGMGTDGHYTSGLNGNLFNGKQRITLIGMSNNINQQNFSNEDLLGALAIPSDGGRRRGRYGPRLGTDPSDFMVGEQGGINTAHSLGLNYIDQWGKKFKITGSYFVNGLENTSLQTLTRQYYLTEAENQTYTESNPSGSSNINHRLNLRMEYTLDSNNSIIYTPRLSFQGNRNKTTVTGENLLNGAFLNSNHSVGFADMSGYSFNQDLLLRHRFTKEGRTLSLGLQNGINTRESLSTLQSLNVYQDTGSGSVEAINQESDGNSFSNSLGLRLMYTEPLGKFGQIMLNYSPERSYSLQENYTSAYDSLSGTYSRLDSVLSSQIEGTTTTQSGGLGLRIRGGMKFMAFLNTNFQQSVLQADQQLPGAFTVDKRFNALLPSAFMRYQFSKTENLRLFYRSSSSLPSASQLQQGIDNSNVLQLEQGNANLNQVISHRLGLRYNRTDVTRGHVLYASFSGNFSTDYIANASWLAASDTVLQGVNLQKGQQLTKPVNLDAYRNMNVLLSYGLPVKALRSNLNLNLSYTRVSTPGKINDILNYTKSNSWNMALVLGSNISEKIDFTLAYTVDVNRVRNSFQPSLNSDYLLHAGSFGINWLPYGGWVLNSQLSYTSYIGLEGLSDNDYLIWNAAIGYKFLKDQAGEFRLSAFDLLKQNNSIARNINEVYVEDVSNQVLQRYFMLTFSYTFRNFNVRK